MGFSRIVLRRRDRLRTAAVEWKWRWSRWYTLERHGIRADAEDSISRHRARGDEGAEWALFRRGKRIG